MTEKGLEILFFSNSITYFRSSQHCLFLVLATTSAASFPLVLSTLKHISLTKAVNHGQADLFVLCPCVSSQSQRETPLAHLKCWELAEKLLLFFNCSPTTTAPMEIHRAYHGPIS